MRAFERQGFLQEVYLYWFRMGSGQELSQHPGFEEEEIPGSNWGLGAINEAHPTRHTEHLRQVTPRIANCSPRTGISHKSGTFHGRVP